MARAKQNPTTATATATQVDERRLTRDNAGLDYARGLPAATRLDYLALLANTMREADTRAMTRGSVMVVLIQACETLEEARNAFAAAEERLRGEPGVTRATDRTWIQYKSNLLRGFRLDVLPSDAFMTEREIRDACLDRVRAEATAATVRDIDSADPVAVSDEADDVEEEFYEWVHTLTPVLRLRFWQDVGRVRRRYADLAAKIATEKRPAMKRRPTARGQRATGGGAAPGAEAAA